MEMTSEELGTGDSYKYWRITDYKDAITWVASLRTNPHIDEVPLEPIQFSDPQRLFLPLRLYILGQVDPYKITSTH